MGKVVSWRSLRHGPPRRLPAPYFLHRRRPAVPLKWLSRSFGFLALAGLMGAAALAAAWPSSGRLAGRASALTGHARVVDGDTLDLNGTRIRLLGMDAPELHQTCRDNRGTAWPCGRVARLRLAALVSTGRVACEPHGHGYYGRTLAWCSAGGVDLGGAMVREGYAVATDSYWVAEAGARLRRRGLWAGDFMQPRDWRRYHPWHGPRAPN